jgi:hypothetical protein
MGGVWSKLGDPHHVSAARSTRAPWVRPHFGAGGLHGASCDGRHLGSGKRTPFTGPPRNRSWRPPSHSVGLAQAGPRSRARRRRQGCLRRSTRSRTGEDNALAQRSHGRRSEGRVVNRDPPQPRSHRVARATRCPLRKVSGSREAGARKKTFRVDEHEPQGSVRERFPRRVAERHSRADQGSQRWEAAKSRVLELECFGVQKSVGRTFDRDALVSYQAHPDTRGLARTNRTRRSDALAATDLG